MSENAFTEFEINIEGGLENVKEWDGDAAPLLPQGEYVLTVEHVEQKPSSTGNPMIVFRFVVAEGPEEGQKVWNNYSLSPKALGRIKKLMVACRTRLDKIVGSDFLGQTILATVVHRVGESRPDANGNMLPAKTFANVVNERPLDGGTEVAAVAVATPPPVLRKPPTGTLPAKNGQGAPRRA